MENENPYTDPTRHDPMFGQLWQLFHGVDPFIDWQSSGVHEKDHKVWVKWRGQQHAIGFVHELSALTPEKFAALLALYFGE